MIFLIVFIFQFASSYSFIHNIIKCILQVIVYYHKYVSVSFEVRVGIEPIVYTSPVHALDLILDMINPFQRTNIETVHNNLTFQLFPIFLNMVMLNHNDYHVNIFQEFIKV